jgi:hypothetical protein
LVSFVSVTKTSGSSAAGASLGGEEVAGGKVSAEATVPAEVRLSSVVRTEAMVLATHVGLDDTGIEIYLSVGMDFAKMDSASRVTLA